MAYDILYEACPWHRRVALLDNGRLRNIHYDDVLRPLLEGAVVLGRVRQIAEGLGAAFVDVGYTVDGFLPLNTVPKEVGKLHEGMALMVRVTRSPVEDKGPRLDAHVLTRKPENPEKIPCLVRPAPNALQRTLMDAVDVPVKVWVNDLTYVNEIEEFIPRDKIGLLSDTAAPHLHAKLDDQLARAAGPVFEIPGGGRLTVEVTRALTAIDVDAGSLVNQKGITALEINKLAATEIARLCMMQEMGGSIIIDFISLKDPVQREALQKHFEQALSMDMTQPRILKMSKFGLVEMNRRRTGVDLMTRLKWPMYVAGEILLKLWRVKNFKGKIKIEACPDVADILRQRLTHDAALMHLGQEVEVVANLGFADDKYALSY